MNSDTHMEETTAPASSASSNCDFHPDVEKVQSRNVDKSQQPSTSASEAPLQPPIDDEKRWLVEFADDDPEKPFNWTFKKKALHTAMYGITTFVAQFNSAVMSAVVPHLMNAYGVGREVAILATSLYVLGIAFGPMFFAPFSEMYGRKIGVMLPFFVSLVLTVGTATADNMAVILVTRFFAGFFAGAPVVSSGGVLADIWTPAYRGISLVFYAVFVTAGASFGSIISAVVTSGSDVAWRWACWVIIIIGFVVLIINVAVLSESYAPVLLARRAANLRIETRQWAYHAKHEEWRLDIKEFFSLHFLRPFAMLATPIVMCIAIFASFVFGVLYLVVTSIPTTFTLARGWEGTVTTLPLIALFLGLSIGSGANIWSGLRYAKLVNLNDGKPLPEQRFPVMMMFAWLLPAGIFMFAWTMETNIHWIVPCLGIMVMGVGFIVIFQGCLNYLVDAFTRYAASAIAANTFLRSVFGAVFPLFGDIMFRNLGVNWGASLVGFIALALTPIPYVFYVFGERLRKRNPYIKLVT